MAQDEAGRALPSADWQALLQHLDEFEDGAPDGSPLFSSDKGTEPVRSAQEAEFARPSADGRPRT